MWRPLLGGPIARQAFEALDAVAAAIQSPLAALFPGSGILSGSGVAQDASLAGGTAGLAIFSSYLSRAGSRRRWQPAALRFLREAGDAVESVTMAPSLYGGFSGVAWAMAHVDKKLSDGDEGYATDSVDDALNDYVNRPGWDGEYDLVGGLVGLAVYALERLPARAAVECLVGIVDRLEEIAETAREGVTWFTPPAHLPDWQREQCPGGYYNLGLAHGVSGVIVVLGATCAAGIRPRKARKLLDGAVTWLLSQELENGAGSRFPAWVAPGAKPEASRSAWCYGDPGIAAALLCAARSVDQPDWERKAIEIARGVATRSPDETGVMDAGLCHGAAGLVHVLNRYYQATGDETLGEAARFWFERTLAMRRPGEGVGGFLALGAKEDGTRYWEDDAGILTGASGIALALLAATTPVEPAWDRMLLLSTPDRG